MKDKETVSNQWKELVYLAKKLDVPVWVVCFAKAEARTNKRYKLEKFIRENKEGILKAIEGYKKIEMGEVKGEMKPLVPHGLQRGGVNIMNNIMKYNDDGSPYLHPVTGKPITIAEYEELAIKHGWRKDWNVAGKLRRIRIVVSERTASWFRPLKRSAFYIYIQEGQGAKAPYLAPTDKRKGKLDIEPTIQEDIYI